jgi:phospholipid/cholesterol/gamma-HCH transport system substrate-binding protein
VDPKSLKLIPQNVDATINATTVFGNKYIAFSSLKNPSPQRLNSSDLIDATHVATEFNTPLERDNQLPAVLTVDVQDLRGRGTKHAQDQFGAAALRMMFEPIEVRLRRGDLATSGLGAGNRRRRRSCC